MAWIVLLVAGAMEAAWAVALSESRGFKRLWPSVIFLVTSVLSLAGLSIAMRDIPTGTAYAVWTGTGAALTVLWAFGTRKEKATQAKALLLSGLVACVIGLKVVA
ncbi:DMT family transporter [Saccharopolyspora elongata]|uniref:Multidrug efflux SMR transporter n=1 Tax=Saccharopolyspora elongata TaxID=2530387 RepID=A0A4R4XQQ7_9PSEU|nr:multidrug efflux SMR transporter [Saccharopolyspora elongata]TDD33209.1 multidrug efflux SMR transporter [Saccharopolyspora elongata]